MISFLVRWFVTAIAVLVVTHVVPGVHYDTYETLAVAALVLGIANAFLRPLLLVITLPFNILTFGILTLFINGFLFWLVGKLVEGFVVAGFWAAFFGALIVSVVSFFLNSLIWKQGRVVFFRSSRAKKDQDVIDI